MNLVRATSSRTHTLLNDDETNNPGKPKAYLAWLFFTKNDFKFIPDASGMLQATDAGQLGDLGVMDITIPENGFLYIYVTNESRQKVDFDHLKMLHHLYGFQDVPLFTNFQNEYEYPIS